MEIVTPNKITNNFQGYVFFSDLYSRTQHCFEEDIVLNFSNTKVIESNLFALLGGVVAELERKKNKISLQGIQEPIKNLFNTKKLTKGKNLKYLWKSFIKCQQFSSPDERVLSEYLETRIFPNRSEISVNQQLKVAIELCVAEIFRNAFAHSNCKDVFIAHYYSVYNQKLTVSIVSLGRSFALLVNKTYKKSLNGIGAIEWAVAQNHTTKRESHNGIGLYTIRQFVKQNHGRIQILSGDGFWKQVKHRTFSKLHENEFPGSVISLEFNLQE